MPREQPENSTRREMHEEDSEEFDKAFLGCVVVGMTNLLGDGGAKATLFHLQSDGSPIDPATLHKKLSSIFKEGSTVIEKMITKELYRSENLPYEESGKFDFGKSVAVLRVTLKRRSESGGEPE